ncbi:alpha/beta hydrolase fold protein [Oryzomicrobium terrae]|uniref:Alpha/beta hydrolase fold protein n=1 Tax=Oryzomicrobium terrae TaxID=1735038 RepID=A0A5C1ED15_9RHOO|nr:alpha/beta hydrolase [Oryzomicrobium terrae]QEL66555.1 alpha/beta hydrolase fold protein [Oryzomicrobium terrae]
MTPKLEIITRIPPSGMARKPVPLLFVHGAFIGAWCWDEYFLPWFAAQGYTVHAVSLRGHGESEGHDHLDWWSIGDYVRDVRFVAAGMERPPVLIGHSMGGFVVQKCLEYAKDEPWPAAALLASVPPQGLAASTMHLAVARPDLFGEINRYMAGHATHPDLLAEVLFAQPVAAERLERYYGLMQGESARALWDMSLFDLPRLYSMEVPPLLVLGAEEDRLIPAAQVRATAAAYDVPAHIFPGMGHGMMLEAEWQQVAEHLAAWLHAQGL